MSDIYQERYLAHQKKKKDQLAFSIGTNYDKYDSSIASTLDSLLSSRRSQRVFTNDPIPNKALREILDSAITAPTSCNRHAIQLKLVREPSAKSLLAGLLVGGVGWVQRANTIILLFADMEAYKSPAEKDFMPYCDVGFTAMSLWLSAEARNIGCAYINPNIREEHKEIFYKEYPFGLFVGAIALGMYDKKAEQASLPPLRDLL